MGRNALTDPWEGGALQGRLSAGISGRTGELEAVRPPTLAEAGHHLGMVPKNSFPGTGEIGVSVRHSRHGLPDDPEFLVGQRKSGTDRGSGGQSAASRHQFGMAFPDLHAESKQGIPEWAGSARRDQDTCRSQKREKTPQKIRREQLRMSFDSRWLQDDNIGDAACSGQHAAGIPPVDSGFAPIAVQATEVPDAVEKLQMVGWETADVAQRSDTHCHAYEAKAVKPGSGDEIDRPKTHRAQTESHIEKGHVVLRQPSKDAGPLKYPFDTRPVTSCPRQLVCNRTLPPKRSPRVPIA